MTSSTLHSSPRSVSQHRAGLGRRMVALAASLLLGTAAVVAVAGPASAHDQLISTNPADGSTIAKLPAQVTLTFGEIVLDTDGGTQVKVTDASGKSINSGPTVVQDNVVSQAVTGAVAGEVTVLWRVLSEDGHPVSGEFRFTVQAADATTAPTTSPTPSPSASPAEASSSPSVLWVIVGILLAVAVIVVLAVAISRRRTGTETESSDDRES